MAAELILHDFDYFSSEPVQQSVVSVTKEIVRACGNKVVEDTDIEFTIPKSTSFTALHESKLCVKVKVLKVTGDSIGPCDHAHATTPDKVSTINNLFHSMWRAVDVSINGHSVDTTNYYPYRAYLDTLTSYSKEVLETRGSTHGWAKDTTGHMQDMNVTGSNAGLVARTKFIESSKVYSMKGRLHCDLFLQGRSIPPNSEIKVTLTPAANTFVLNTPEDNKKYVLQIVDIHFEIVRQTTPPSLTEAVQSFISKPHDISLRRVNVTTHMLTQGRKEETLDKLFHSDKALPDRFFVFLVDHNGLTGSYKINPFDFAKHSLSFIQATVNTDTVPRRAYTPEWDAGAVNEYLALLEEFGADEANHVIDISQKEFANGYAIYPFRVVPRCSNGDILGPPVIGNISLDLKFSTALSSVVGVVIVSEHRDSFKILEPGSVGISAK